MSGVTWWPLNIAPTAVSTSPAQASSSRSALPITPPCSATASSTRDETHSSNSTRCPSAWSGAVRPVGRNGEALNAARSRACAAWASSRSGWALAPVATALTCRAEGARGACHEWAQPRALRSPRGRDNRQPSHYRRQPPARQARGDHRGDPRRRGRQDVREHGRQPTSGHVRAAGAGQEHDEGHHQSDDRGQRGGGVHGGADAQQCTSGQPEPKVGNEFVPARAPERGQHEVGERAKRRERCHLGIPDHLDRDGQQGGQDHRGAHRAQRRPRGPPADQPGGPSRRARRGDAVRHGARVVHTLSARVATRTLPMRHAASPTPSRRRASCISCASLGRPRRFTRRRRRTIDPLRRTPMSSPAPRPR